jgi:hypothetical protein
MILGLVGEFRQRRIIEGQRLACLFAPPFHGYQAGESEPPCHEGALGVIGVEFRPKTPGQILKQVVGGMEIIHE